MNLNSLGYNNYVEQTLGQRIANDFYNLINDFRGKIYEKKPDEITTEYTMGHFNEATITYDHKVSSTAIYLFENTIQRQFPSNHFHFPDEDIYTLYVRNTEICLQCMDDAEKSFSHQNARESIKNAKKVLSLFTGKWNLKKRSDLTHVKITSILNAEAVWGRLKIQKSYLPKEVIKELGLENEVDYYGWLQKEYYLTCSEENLKKVVCTIEDILNELIRKESLFFKSMDAVRMMSLTNQQIKELNIPEELKEKLYMTTVQDSRKPQNQ